MHTAAQVLQDDLGNTYRASSRARAGRDPVSALARRGLVPGVIPRPRWRYDDGVWSLASRRGGQRAQALSRAITGLPADTRRAMLEAVDADELIVGAYTDRFGRVCPTLAAHRRGVRTGGGAFPRAWDSFARATRPRLATERELEILKAMLEESFAGSPPPASPPRGQSSRAVDRVAAVILKSR